MNYTFFLLALIFAIPASANSLLDFTCRTTKNLDKRKPVTIKFQMRTTPTGQFRYVNPDEEETFKVTPKNSFMFELNENGSIRQDKQQVTFFGDGDGFVLVYLSLYKNTGYRTGFARIVDKGGGTGNHYATVSCKIIKL